MAVSPESIRSIIAVEASLDEAKLKPDATLQELDIGSIDVVSVLFALEDQYGIEIEPEAIDPNATISQFVDHVMCVAKE